MRRGSGCAFTSRETTRGEATLAGKIFDACHDGNWYTAALRTR